MPSFFLTSGEKVRFAEWLRNEIDADEQIIEQMQKINLPGIITQHLHVEIAAKKIVLKILTQTETMTIEGKDNG